jgi:hypothetical protein
VNATSRRLGAVRAAGFHRVRNSIATSLLSMMMVFWSVLPVGAQDARLVLNPYDGIDWQSATHHKANFHTHTTESDGRLSPQQTIDEYRQRGYGVLAITDHDRNTYPWQKWDRDPQALGMVAVSGNELSRHHHTLSLFTDFTAVGRDLDKVLAQLAAHGDDGLAVLCHPAMHWPREFGVEPGLRTPLAPLSRITRGDFTIETWFRTTDQGRNLLMGNYTGDHPGALNLELHTENRVRVFVQPASGGRTVDLNVPGDALQINTRDGQWHHLAGVRRDGVVALYLDGKPIGSQADTAGSFDLQGEFYYFGRDTRTGSTVLEGDLDHVRLWTRGLSADEVAQLAQGQQPGDQVSADELLLQFPFETADGRAVAAGDRPGLVIDDSSAHAAGPFHASAEDGAPVRYIAEVAPPLAAAGASSHALRFGARGEAQQVPRAAVEQYLDLYRHHQRLIGIEVLNGTRPLHEYWLDRQLWDKLLTELMPDRPVWGLATDDMHSMTHLGRDWVVFPVGDLDVATVRQAMLRGAFYFCTTRLHAPEQASVETTPRITSIVHDPDAGTITVQATVQGQPVAADAYQWISSGKVVQSGPQLDYRQADGIDNYARLEIQGSGGTTYTNPFGFSTIAPGTTP